MHLCTLIEQNAGLLREAARLVSGLDERAFEPPAGVARTSGAGAHLRHCLDFYDRFLEGVAAGRVDYTERRRDPATERDPARAAARLLAAAEALESLVPPSGVAGLLVRAEGAGEAADAASWGRSSVARELQFLLSHTVHHFALVAILLRLHGVEPGAEFGVAPSTLARMRAAS